MSRRVLLSLLLALACAHTPAEAPAPAPTKAPVAEAPSPPATIPGEQVLAVQPVIPPLSPFNAPIPTVVTLKNGLKLYIVERPGEIEGLALVIKRGATADPAKLPGLASMSAQMLETGAAGMSQFALAQAADKIGARLGSSSSEDATVVSISAMPERLPKMVSLLAAVGLKPTLSATEWKKLSARRLAQLLAQRAEPSAAASLAWKKAAYGSHPLGEPVDGTLESIKRMKLSDVRSFIKGFAPGDSAIIAVGGAKAAVVQAELEKAFSGWKGRATPDTALAQRVQAAPVQGPRFIAVDFPGKPQTVIRMGEPSVSRASPDYLALNVLNAVLGGSFTSRLNQNLREQHGYTYGAFSRFAFGVGPGPFGVATNVKTDVTAPALEQIFAELARAVKTPISDAELAKGKALLAFDLVQELEHTSSETGAIAAIFLYDLPLDEYQTFVPRLNAVTVADVQAAAQRALHPDRMTLAVAGDLKAILPAIAQDQALGLPAPARWGPDGAPLSAKK